MLDMPQADDVPRTLIRIRRNLMADEAFKRKYRHLRGTGTGFEFFFSFGCFAVGITLDVIALVTLVWWLFPLALLLQLAGIVGLSSVQHEAWHQRALPNRVASNFVAEWILAPLFMNDFAMSAQAHMSHHRHMGEDNDPDKASWHPSWKDFWMSQLKRWLIIPAAISVLRGLMSGGRVAERSDNESKGVPKITYLRIATFHAIWIAIAISASWVGFFVAYLLPLLVGQTLVSIRGQREHVYLPDGRLRTFETMCPDYERLFIGGGHFNLHAVHHVFPEVPQQYQPKLLKLILDNEKWKKMYCATPLIVMRPSYFSPRPWQE